MSTRALRPPTRAAESRQAAHTSRWPLLLLSLLAAVLVPLLWLSLRAPTTLRIEIGAWGDQASLTGVHGPEQGGNENYRWTEAEAGLRLPNLSSTAHILRLRAHGWRPDQPAPTMRLEVNNAAWGAFPTTPDLRTYHVLLPPDPLRPERTITLHSETFTPPGDPRPLGVALDWLALQKLDSRAPPAPGQFGGQLLLLALAFGLLWRLRLPTGWMLAAAAACGGALVWANWRNPLWVGQALAAWLLVLALLLGATWAAAPHVVRWLRPWLTPRQARVAWALFIAGLGLRLLGSVHPLFETHDLHVHVGWLDKVLGGQLYLYSTPGELRNRQIFNPPGGYVMLAPLVLALPSLRLAIQVGVALLDALAGLLLLPIARELRLPAHAGLLALALAVALPISMTMLWWGFATNALAQALWVLLMWLLLRLVRHPTRGNTVIFGVAVASNMLMHAGALVLLVAMLGLLVVFGWPRLAPPSRRALLSALLASGLVLGPLYFAAAAGPIVQQRGASPSVASLDLAASLARGWEHRALRLGYTGAGWLRGFTLPLLALLPLGLAQLATAERRHPLQRALVGAWISICVLFAAAYLSLAMVSRYIYFSTPLVCLAAGWALARLWRTPAGRVFAVTLVLATAFTGLALWAAGVLVYDKPSLVPLTH